MKTGRVVVALIAVAAVALAGALAACSGDSEPETPDSAESTVTEEAESASAAATDESASAAATDESASESESESEAAERSTWGSETSGGELMIGIDDDTTWQEVFDTFTPSELSCIRNAWGNELLASVLDERLMAGIEWFLYRSEAEWLQRLGDLASCLSERAAQDVFIAILVAGFAVDRGEMIGADQQACLRAAVAEFDIGGFVAAAVSCLEAGPFADADALENATRASVGGSVDGALRNNGDFGLFVFEAKEGARYRIDVSLGTLGDSVLTLSDAGGRELDYSDDYADSRASRIEWEAPASGNYYLVVDGYGGDTGSYTLTITVLAWR